MAPPRIMFDDGSRVFGDAAPPAAASDARDVSPSARGSVPLDVYYEADRVAKEAVEKLDWSSNTLRGRLFRLVSATASLGDGDTSEEAGSGEAADGQKGSGAKEEDDGFLCRVALQFPDELLADAPEVSWLMESAISDAYKQKLLPSPAQLDEEAEPQLEQHLARPPLIFVLGDTTYGACCPDEVSANHLNANLIVHYGHACLAPTESVPVVYAFGVSDVGDGSVWKECADLISKEIDGGGNGSKQVEEAMAQMSMEDSAKRKKLLVLYDVRYHHAMKELTQMLEATGKVDVVLGAIPKQQLSVNRLGAQSCGSGGCGAGACSSESAVASPSNACCASGTEEQSSQSCCAKDTLCCDESGDDACSANDAKHAGTTKDDDATNLQKIEEQHIPRTIGGLEIPNELELSQCTVLYIGDDLNIESYESNAPTRLLHILLRCNAPDGPPSTWSYSPIHCSLNTDVLNAPLSPTNSTSLSTALSRTLRRRYFLLNKAKLATTIAILIGTTSNSYSFRKLLSRTRKRIQSTGRTAYTFAVGKLSSSASKLTNFAEIDCFVLIACQESIAKFWRMEREEMLMPVLTPLELDVALGFREWDGRYSCDFGDVMRWDKEDGIVDGEEGVCGAQDGGINPLGVAGNVEEGSSDDEPFFSMISGKYEQSKTISKTKQDLEALPGQGKLIEYRSEAAEFLKQREYRGLEANVGETEVKAAVKGQVGIASNYGEKL
ncbi:hypothetical protein ACHAXT_005538 [Thalassiosira profunda]